MVVELEDRCCIKRCRAESGLIYYGIGICQFHWSKACQVERKTKIIARKIVYKRVIPAAQKRMREVRSMNIATTKKDKSRS